MTDEQLDELEAVVRETGHMTKLEAITLIAYYRRLRELERAWKDTNAFLEALGREISRFHQGSLTTLDTLAHIVRLWDDYDDAAIRRLLEPHRTKQPIITTTGSDLIGRLLEGEGE